MTRILPNLESCLPPIPGVDWPRMAEIDFVFVGAGAGNRPLARDLAFLGMGRAVFVDPKRYKEPSIVSQCAAAEVGANKAEIAAAELRNLGVHAEALVADINDVEPGWVGPNAMLIACVDDRRGDVGANRLAAMMGARLVKFNLEPLLLTASLRCYELSDPAPQVCLECAMTDAQYAVQRHPASCDGGGPERPTGSPRALSHVAAGAAALAIAQIVCAPAAGAKQWINKQWQLNLLSGRATWSDLTPNPSCRWDHDTRWHNLTRLGTGPDETTLDDLLAAAHVEAASAKLRFSAPVTTRARCGGCGLEHTQVHWARDLNKPVGACACGGPLFAVPFWTSTALPATALRTRRSQCLAAWGVPPRAVIAVEGAQSFVLGA